MLVFDVNETLPDIDSLEPLFSRLFGDKRVLREWFAQLVLYSQAVTLAGLYATFSEIGTGTLRMLGETHNARTSDSDVEELKSRMRNLPVHSEVPVALQRFRDADFQLATLTNSAPDPQGTPLERTGLNRYFERMFSVHDSRRFKPAVEIYRAVAGSLGVTPSALCMVAAHAWDTLGAQAAGCFAALVTRHGNAPLPVEGLPQADIVAADLALVADQIIKRWR